MPGTEADENLRCDLCGRSIAEVDGGRDELRVELTRDDGDLQFWVGDFCTQAHAAEWLQRPLPEAISPSPPPRSTTWRDRLADVGLFVAAAWVLVLLLLGSWTVAQFVGDRF